MQVLNGVDHRNAECLFMRNISCHSILQKQGESKGKGLVVYDFSFDSKCEPCTRRTVTYTKQRS